jgi:hypothetical protein
MECGQKRRAVARREWGVSGGLAQADDSFVNAHPFGAITAAPAVRDRIIGRDHDGGASPLGVVGGIWPRRNRDALDQRVPRHAHEAVGDDEH